MVNELNSVHAHSGSTFVPFWDDALTAKIPRTVALCEAIERDIQFPLTFSAITRAMVDTFSTLGVVVPFPGTPIYDDRHADYGFTDWWLDERYSHYSAYPPLDDVARFDRFYIDDTNLQLDFFRYDAATRDMIRECLRIKGEHNLRHMGLLRDPVFAPEPMAAAAA